MKLFELSKFADLRSLLAMAALLTLSLGMALFVGMFWRLPKALWPFLGLQTPAMVLLNFCGHFLLAYLPAQVFQRTLVHIFNLDLEADSIGPVRKVCHFTVVLIAGVLASAIFSITFLDASSTALGQAWIGIAAVAVPLFLASDRMIWTVQKLYDGGALEANDVRRLRRLAKTLGVVLVSASFMCGELHMGQRLCHNAVHAEDVPGDKWIWTAPAGEIWAYYKGSCHALRKTVMWYAVPAEKPTPRRAANTTDLLMREGVGRFLGQAAE